MLRLTMFASGAVDGPCHCFADSLSFAARVGQDEHLQSASTFTVLGEHI